jgi:predicted esterase YcpF (UPF0227 family)
MSDITPNDLSDRVAVLEEIASSTKQVLADLRTEMRQGFAEMRTEMRDMRTEMRDIRTEHRSDYRWLLGIMLGGFVTTIGGFAAMLGVMAHGFHWI